jgi:hypothetical protein
MRDLAHRLLDYEVVAGKSGDPSESATLRVYEKLRQGLSEFAGATGFQSLASRALALARTEAPSLIARLLGLLLLIVGEALTLSLLRITWPGAAFDEGSFENRRKT